MDAKYLTYFLIFLSSITVIDLYCFKALILFTLKFDRRTRLFLFFLFWSISAIFLFSILSILSFPPTVRGYQGYSRLIIANGLLFLFYVPKFFFIPFHLFDDFNWLWQQLLYWARKKTPKPRKMTASHFGLFFGLLFFSYTIYGMMWGKFNYRVQYVTIKSPKIPASFSGYRIAQFSDFHAGSMEHRKDKVRRGFKMMMDQKPDLILFTGDLVNHFSQETDGWQDVFSMLNAPDGKYSVLGNHDYGDYVQWPRPGMREQNNKQIIDFENKVGFTVLNDAHVFLHRGNDSIALAGVQNWSKPPFHQYGNLKKAMQGVPDSMFTVLMSHDPAYWDLEVKHTPVSLTLSGHTHAMQMGIEIGRFSWSPAKLMYPLWWGLYKEGSCNLYVNRGFGFLAFPGRFGMKPEITIITLIKN
jgi:uncharacterized protein